MEHARKMVLVPEDSLLQMGSQQPTNITDALPQTQANKGIAATLSRLDIEMNEILNSNAYKDEREKWGAYLIVLQRYLHFADSERAQQYFALIKKNETGSGNHEENKNTDNSSMNDSIIIESVPAKYRPKAKHLLRHLHEAPPSAFSWDSRGTVSLGGRAIKDSNIVDLVNDAMRARKVARPAGRKAFAKFLKTIRTPREFIGNEELWMETVANSTVQPGMTEGMDDTSIEDLSEIGHNEFYSGSEHSPQQHPAEQHGSGYCNKKKRVIWANLKL